MNARFTVPPRLFRRTAMWAAAIGAFMAIAGHVFAATDPSTTVYVARHFEVRGHDQPTKYVFAGNTRVAAVTGSLSSNGRVQRLRLATGWNLVSLAVTTPDLLGAFQQNEPGIVDGVYRWDQGSRGYSAVAEGSTVPAGAVLWVRATKSVTVALTGGYTEPADRVLPAGGGYVGSAGLETWTLPLPPASSSWTFDAQSHLWDLQVADDAALPANAPPVIAPGAGAYVSSAMSVSLAGPDPDLRLHYHHQDHIGSTAALTDASGQLVEESALYPFGAPRSRYKPAPFSEPYEFSQKERDDESRLHYFEARYLSSAPARFMSVDFEFAAAADLPTNRFDGFLAHPQLLNLYTYVMNNPVRWVDLNGLSPGDPFRTADEAAADALLAANPRSIRENREYGGLVYYNPNVKRYYATVPTTGDTDSFQPSAVAVPAGTSKVGDYHTHGDYTAMVPVPTITTDAAGHPTVTMKNLPFHGIKAVDFYDSDHFSQVDLNGISSDATGIAGYKGYLGTPSGGFRQYDPASGQVLPLAAAPVKAPVSCKGTYVTGWPYLKVTCD